MASNTNLIKKLQNALNSRGEKILYQTSQWYSDRENRPVTVYAIKKSIQDEEKGKNKVIELFKSNSQIQVVLFLRDYWYEINGWEVPDNNVRWNEIKAGREEQSWQSEK